MTPMSRVQHIPNIQGHISIHTRTHTHTHILAHTHTYTHTQTHTHTHTRLHFMLILKSALFVGVLLYDIVFATVSDQDYLKGIHTWLRVLFDILGFYRAVQQHSYVFET